MLLRIYDFLNKHSLLRYMILLGMTCLLSVCVMHLSCSEDISDFLPLQTRERDALKMYQETSGANRLIVLFDGADDVDTITQAIDDFAEALSVKDTASWTHGFVTQIDMDRIEELQDFVYSNIPYFLQDSDYVRMERLLSTDGYAQSCLQRDKEMLMFPAGSLLSQNISRDPYNLFTPVVQLLQTRQQQLRFEIHDGYILTPDMKKGIVMLTSPFGNAETENNTKLIALMDDAIADAEREHPSIDIRIVGGPQIAVDNARQIKVDSILAVSISVVLILLLLIVSIRSVRNIILMALSISWGWLFALAGMSLFSDSVSLIAIGISSIILGIAVNYPLHLITHVGHTPDRRQALKEIVGPLLVGNITTVGAFFALVPLESPALRDLGLFASMLLIGTILFVLVFLPHSIKIKEESHDIKWLARLCAVRLENKRWLVVALGVMTIVFAWFSQYAEFDANLSNVNYMTKEQRADFDYLRKLLEDGSANTQRMVLLPTDAVDYDAALEKRERLMAAHPYIPQDSVLTRFLPSRSERKRRLERWNRFVTDHGDVLTTQLHAEARKAGFSAEAFADFTDIVCGSYEVKDFAQFSTLAESVFASSLYQDQEHSCCVVIDRLSMDDRLAEKVKRDMPHSFEIEDINSAMARSLSDNFNYIGIACSCLVFLFLWFSFRRFSLAVISFVPMLVSWVWILGIMGLLGVKFNIVNIILATFIFGQGDDYTIFVTEGCVYEHVNKRPVLASYKYSILLSAVIMFVGIGTLILAKHPALHSLAVVTIVGMSCVVFMSWIIPPLLFRLMVRYLKFSPSNK